jgi:hypothetical protein
MTPGTFAVFAVVAANYQPRYRVCRGNPGPPTLGEHPEQRPRPLFSAVSGNISASFDRILMATTISNLKLLVNLTYAVCASI